MSTTHLKKIGQRLREAKTSSGDRDMHIWMDPDLYAKLETVTIAAGIPMSKVVRALLEDALKWEQS